MNVVIFQVNGSDDDVLQGAAPARAEDAVRQVWRQVQQERPVPASEITRVHTFWQPSRVDRIFMAATFRGAEFTSAFDRPEGDDWSAAIAAADQAMARFEAEELTRRVAKVESEGEWLPTLHTCDGPLKFYASLPLAGDRLHFGFAKAIVSDSGRVTMNHLLRNRLDEMSEDEIGELAADATGNLARGLVFGVHLDADKGPLVIVQRGENNLCAASAIVLGGFHQTATELIGEDELIVGLTSPDHLHVAGAGSGWVEDITNSVRNSPDTSGDLVPTLLRTDGSGHWEIVTERPTGRLPAESPA